MKISIIVSVSENWAIGKDNKLLWKLSDDLKRFKEITSGNPVIMGQKTFESLPKGALPNRLNIVLTDNPNFTAEKVISAYNIEDALNKAKSHYDEDVEVFIIGGGSIYKQFLELADFIYLTLVHIVIDGDTFFPKLSNDWSLIYNEFKSKDENNEFDHTYKIFKKLENGNRL